MRPSMRNCTADYAWFSPRKEGKPELRMQDAEKSIEQGVNLSEMHKDKKRRIKTGKRI